MKIVLVVNPAASSVKPRSTDQVIGALGTDHDVEVVVTTHQGHATELAAKAAAEGAGAVVCLGGDGTANECANGLVGTDCALAALPGGSTNVFSRAAGGHRKLSRAQEQLRAALERPPQRVGLGKVNGRYFTFHVGVGFDAEVVERVERKPELKRKLGQAVFVYSAFATWFSYDRREHHFTVAADADHPEADGYFAVCLNTSPYTYFGIRRLNLAPEAALDRPLALVNLKALKLGMLLSLMGSALGSGRRIGTHRSVDYRLDRATVTIRSTSPFSYQADGDPLGQTTELEISHEPDCLLLIR